MPLTDVNLYLDPWYLSYWTYLNPALTTSFALICLYGGIRELIQFRRGEKQSRIKSIFWSILFIGTGSAMLIMQIPKQWYQAYHLKNANFATSPYFTLTPVALILHDGEKSIPWQDIESIYYLKNPRSPRIGGMRIELKDGRAIQLELSFKDRDTRDVAALMYEYITPSPSTILNSN